MSFFLIVTEFALAHHKTLMLFAVLFAVFQGKPASYHYLIMHLVSVSVTSEYNNIIFVSVNI